MMEINYNIFLWFNSLVGMSDQLDFIILFVADYLDMVVLVGALVFFLFHKDYGDRRRFFSYQQMRTRIKESILVAFSTFSTWGIVVLLKKIFAVPRPYLYLENVNLLFVYGNFDSFPSGHAAFFAALAVAVYFHHKRLSMLLGVFALLIGLARIISGIHLPFDIIVGYILGGMIAWVFYSIYVKIFTYLRTQE